MREKSRLRSLVIIALTLSFLVPTPAAGSTPATDVTLWIGNPIMLVGTARQPIDAEGTKPVIVEGRTLVPIRAVIEAFGGVVEWDSSVRRVMVVLGDNVLDLWIGRSTASLNGASVPIDAANPRIIPVILSGRTMLPLRFVSESLGIDVLWEPAAKMIKLTRAEEPPLEVPSRPSLVAPAERSQFVNVLPWLVWQKGEDADISGLRILSPAGAEVLTRSNLSDSSYHVPSGVLPDGTYTWQVCLHNKGGWGPWSEPRSFILATVNAPPAPTLVSPLDQATADVATTVFTWTPVMDADRYRIRFLSGEDVIAAEDGLSDPSYTIPFDSVPIGAGEYSWQVGARGTGGWSAWSTASTFSIPRPGNATILKRLPTFRGGRGDLTIKLDAGRDGVLKLVEQGAAQASITIYLRAGSSTTVNSIPDGVYRVLYALGESYDTQHGVFTRNMSSAEFDETIAYTTTRTTYSSWTLTLYSVSDGNASTTPLPGDTFGGY